MMTRRPWIFAFAILVGAAPASPAQVFLAPPPVVVVSPVGAAPAGFGFTYQRRSLLVSGFHGGPVVAVPVYQVVSGARVIQVITPSIGVRPYARLARQEIDLSGVDLDVVGPEALRPGGQPAPERIAGPPAFKKPLEKVAVARPIVPPAKPGVEAPPKPAAAAPKPPLPKPVPAEKPVPPPVPAPKPELLEESRRLADLGVAAFRERAYGLAALRFRQAAEVEPAQGLSYFLLAQAYVALGKFKDAAAAIENGMLRQDDWPLSPFQPRLDLYKGIEDDWLRHMKQLADAQAAQPKHFAYLFLKAYQHWFDGQRGLAVELFERARMLAPENPFVRAFLKVMPKLAAK